MTVFTNGGQGTHQVSFAAPYPGKILPLGLEMLGGELICQKDAFFCAAKVVSVGIAFQRRIGVDLFDGEGFIMQRLQGNGMAFLHAGGTVHALDLTAGQSLRVDTGCLVALPSTVVYDIQMVRGIKSALFGGEGLFFATLSGPGRAHPSSHAPDRVAARGRLGPRRHRRPARRRPVAHPRCPSLDALTPEAGGYPARTGRCLCRCLRGYHDEHVAGRVDG